jgi:hypothetical protein
MENDNNDPIGDALNILPIKHSDDIPQTLEITPDSSLDQDFESARTNIHDMIDTASEAIKDLSTIAKQSQHPRAFEVLAKLIETSVKANKDLIEIQEKMKQINRLDGKDTGGSSKTINNNLFVGSTAELQKLIKDMKDGKQSQ